MARIPFWLVILFALILVVAGGVTLLHRSGLISLGTGTTLQQTQTIPAETGLIVTAVERRNPGILIVEARTTPLARVTLARNNEKLVAETADRNGFVSLPARLTDPYSGPNGWLALQVMAAKDTANNSNNSNDSSHQPVSLLVKLTPRSTQKSESPLSLIQQPDGTWQSVSTPAALAIETITETPSGDWQLRGLRPQDQTAQRPAIPTSPSLLLQLYSDDTLLSTIKPDGNQFSLIVAKTQRPQKSLRVDIYDAVTAAPIVRLQLPVPFERAPNDRQADSAILFERLPASVAAAPVWIVRDAAAQQGDPADLRPGQIIPVAAEQATDQTGAQSAKPAL